MSHSVNRILRGAFVVCLNYLSDSFCLLLRSLRGMVVIKGRRPDVGSLDVGDDTDEDSDDEMGASSSHVQSSAHTGDTKVRECIRSTRDISAFISSNILFRSEPIGNSQYKPDSELGSAWYFASSCTVNSIPWYETE